MRWVFPNGNNNLSRLFFGNQINVSFLDDIDSVTKQSNVIVWAAHASEFVVDALKAEQCKVVLLEDGFLRSVGLGINHARPLSLVIDSRGMYYDCSKESDLEHILMNLILIVLSVLTL